MSYLGRGLEQVDNISKLDNITFNGGTTYALTKDSAAFTPISSNAILISIDGVVQQGNFSVSGTNIVFNFSPTSSNTCNWILHMGTGVAFTPADSSITKDKANFISTSSAAGLQIKGDGTTDGTLQLNCSQNSHGIKLKSPAHSTSSSYTLTFPGTDPAANKMLQTDGSGNLSFVDTPSGTYTQLYKTSGGSGGGVSSISTGQIFTSDYNMYEVFFTGAPVNNDDYMKFRYIDNTGADVNHNYYHTVSFMVQKDHDNNNENTENTSVNNNINHGRIYVSGSKGSNNHPGAFRMTIFDPRGQTVDNSERCRAIFDSCYYTNGNNQTREIGDIFHNFEFVEYNTGRTAGGFKLECSTGNIGQHQLEVYGIKRA